MLKLTLPSGHHVAQNARDGQANTTFSAESRELWNYANLALELVLGRSVCRSPDVIDLTPSEV